MSQMRPMTRKVRTTTADRRLRVAVSGQLGDGRPTESALALGGRRAYSGAVATGFLRLVGVAIASVGLLAGCSAASQATSSPTQTAAAPTSSPSASASSLADLTSTTVLASAAPAGSIRVQLAGPPPHYNPAALSAKRGTVVFFLDNVSQGIHTLAIGPLLHDPLAVSGPVRPGQAALFTVHDLPAGQYIIWCTIDGHAAEGMTGTLRVQ